MPAREVRTSRLTTEEWAALSLSATGLTVTEVAVALDASPEAVRAVLASAVRKLGARSKLEAVVLALQTGQISQPAGGPPLPCSLEDHAVARPCRSFATLAPREHEIALLIAAGLKTTVIARRLGLAPETVNTYIQNIKGRL